MSLVRRSVYGGGQAQNDGNRGIVQKVARILAPMANLNSYPLDRCSIGVPGLDSLLNGGLVRNRLYIVNGLPGTGKTILGIHFLLAGLNAGENVLFIHGEESKEDILLNAAELNLNLDQGNFLDIGPESGFFHQSKSYDIVNPRDIEDERLVGDVRQAIEEHNPDRVLIDPISQFQYIEPTEYQFRKRIIAFTRFLKDRNATVLATKTPGLDIGEQLQSLSDGVIELKHTDETRRIRVSKHRGVGQRDGTHGLEISAEGLQVYPAIRPESHERRWNPRPLPSGVEGLDSLLDGGLEQGTVTIISGPSGVGKSTTAAEFLHTAAADDGRSIAYLFEESIETFTHRGETFGMPVTELQESGSLIVEEVLPQTRSPEEFARLVQRQVESEDANIVVLDGIEGYRTAIKGDEGEVDLRKRLHALTRYLTNVNVSVILIDERHEVTGLPRPTGSKISYLADNLVFLQYVELGGELHRVMGVLKKRVSGFEHSPRRFRITEDGLTVGDPITDVHGILRGIPERPKSDSSI